MNTTLYDIPTLEEERLNCDSDRNRPLSRTVGLLIAEANYALTRKPPVVTDKPRAPHSQSFHDYYSVAPYHWPLDKTLDSGKTHEWRDGERIPESKLFSELSMPFDRSRLQLFLDHSTVLSLAWFFTGRQSYLDQVISMTQAFFLDPDTCMTPHLRYAQTLVGDPSSEGRWQGLIDFNGLTYFLDAMRILGHYGAMGPRDLLDLKSWFRELLKWLLESPQGKKARSATNNLGTYFDLTVAAIAEFVGDTQQLHAAITRASSRGHAQFSTKGQQPLEGHRTLPLHYSLFNLNAWTGLLRIQSLTASTELDPMLQQSVVRNAAVWSTKLAGNRSQLSRSDRQLAMVIAQELSVDHEPTDNLYLQNSLPSRYSGIRPFWNLGFKPVQLNPDKR